MNAFTSNIGATPVVTSEVTRTANGMRAFSTTTSAALDLFGSIGASRGKDVSAAFLAAYNENKDYALRIAQWARDIRGGAGERKIYRDILKLLETHDKQVLLESRILDNLPEIGRFDDLFIFDDVEVKARAYQVIIRALRNGNGLAAKWAPRKGKVAVELRHLLGMTPKQYRKFVVGLTDVVEQDMCSRNWSEINFSHVPSLAMTRYMTAFHRNAPEAFTEYKEALKRNDGTAKVNAGAVYPHDVIAALGGSYGFICHWNSGTRGDETVANAMWAALPDYMNGKGNVLPLVDVSGSMHCPAGGSRVMCLDVALSLGLYVAEKSKGAFKDVFMTFSSDPELIKVEGTLTQKLTQMGRSNWSQSTNLHAAVEKVLSHALAHRVPQEDMPATLLIFSDMQFNTCVKHDDRALRMIERKYEDAGYKMPQVVFWNLKDYGSKPVRSDESGTALVSGFSPALLESLLADDLASFTPENIMLKTIMKERYNW